MSNNTEQKLVRVVKKLELMRDVAKSDIQANKVEVLQSLIEEALQEINRHVQPMAKIV